MAEPTDDPDYRIVAKVNLERFYKEQESAQSYGNELAKWMLATLTLINGGAILALLQAGQPGRLALQICGFYFVYGIIAAVICGFFAWINSAVRDQAYSEIADARMLVSIDHWPKPSIRNNRLIILTYWASIIAGLASLGLFVAGCNLAQWGLFSP